MRTPKAYCRNFLLKHRAMFERGYDGTPLVKRGPAGAVKQAANKRAYYKHAMAAVDFLLHHLEHYRESPFFPSDNPPAA